MDGVRVNGLVAVLVEADLDGCDRAGLAELVDVAQRLRSWLDAFEVSVASAATRLAEQGGCEPAVALVNGDGRRGVRDADAVARRSKVCELLPTLHQALAGGSVSAGHADAVAQVAAQLDGRGRAELVDLQASLVRSAQTSTVEAYAREVRDLGRILARDDGVRRHEQLRRQRSLKRWVDRHGMCHTRLALDPETDARVSAALDAAVSSERAKPDDAPRSFEQLCADAMVELITGEHRTGRAGAQVSVLIDIDTLRLGLHDQSVCETADAQPLPPDAVRRIACDADLIPIVLDRAGVVLDVGRSARVASEHQRNAPRAMYRSCAHPGCTVRFEACQVHHVIAWHHGGRTDLTNLLPLCSRHHHLVHEGGWTLTLQPDRTITLRRPDGTVSYSGTSLERPPRASNPADDARPRAPAA